MPLLHRFALVAAFVTSVWPVVVHADPKTVCTITVNSPDERETFRRNLPADQYQFVELVERGRPDWLASACRKGVRCDVLLISGHFDGGDEFYSDKVDARESLPVDEMERVSCSESCPGLFSQLKEVYLFGCNTLNAEAIKSASGEVVRSLLRAGHSAADAEQLAQVLSERHAGSNRERMRQIFKDVPVIYGFSSKAPLGRSAGPVLERYLQTGGVSEIATGRPSAKLLQLFASVSMTVATGSTHTGTDAAYRADVCHFSDDRLTAAQKLDFVHTLLGRDMAEVRMFLDHLEKYSPALVETAHADPPAGESLDRIATDSAERDRYFAFMRDADQASVRARMIELAVRLGWLTPEGKRAELIAMINDRLGRLVVGAQDVDLVCTLNREHGLDDTLAALASVPPERMRNVGHAGVLACLGNQAARERMLQAITSVRDDDVQIAQLYLHHRPIVDVDELRVVAASIARMDNPVAQVRALDTLARHRLSDERSLAALTSLFPVAKSLDVQRAIAGILIRADYASLAKPDLVRALQTHRRKSSDGQDLIDILIRRLQASLPPAA